jgi:hypothetical protein
MFGVLFALTSPRVPHAQNQNHEPNHEVRVRPPKSLRSFRSSLPLCRTLRRDRHPTDPIAIAILLFPFVGADLGIDCLHERPYP